MAKWSHDSEVPVGDDVQETFTLPARYYTDPAVLEAERDQLFGRTWQLVGDRGRVAEPGDYLTREVAGESVVVARDGDGDLNAFHNVCAHRGSRILDEESGHKRMFQCPYHGWTYDLDGTFNSAPNFDDDCLDCEANSLREVHVATAGPTVWVSLAPDPDPLDAFLGEVTDELAAYSAEEFERVRTVEYDIDCNWKVYVDNYLECDHCQLNHASFVDSLDMDEYEIRPRETHVAQYGDIDEDGEMTGDGDDRVAPEARGRYFAAWVWPNTTIDVTPRSFETARIQPVDHESTVLVVDYYNRSGEVTDEWEEGFAFSQEVMLEDLELCERQHAGLASGVFRQGRLGPNENGVHRFQTLMQDRLDA